MDQTSPLKEATLRRREEAVYPLRKILQGGKVKYQFLESPPDPRVSQLELIIRVPSADRTEYVRRAVSNSFRLRGFHPSQARDMTADTFSLLHTEEAGFQTRTVIKLNYALASDNIKVLASILVKSEPA